MEFWGKLNFREWVEEGNWVVVERWDVGKDLGSYLSRVLRWKKLIVLNK